MYSKKIPFKDFKGNPRNQMVHFNLTEREVIKFLPELQSMFNWLESNRKGEQRNLDTNEVRDFYNNFEEVLLEAWGEPSEDGLHFRKGQRYEFEESALFNATMFMFVQQPEETGKMLDGIMPEGLTQLVKNATPEQIQALPSDQQEGIEELRRRLAEAEANSSPTTNE